MRNFLKKHDMLLRLLSLLFAVACWFFVMGINDPEIEMTVRRVPLNYTGEYTLQESYNMQIVAGRVATVNLRVRGSRSDLLRLKKTDITAYVDVAGVEEAGNHNLNCTVRLPNSKLELANKDQLYLNLFIDSIVEVDVPVVAEITGNAAEGCTLGAARISPSTVKISGPSSELRNLSHAQIVIKTGMISESFFGEYSYKLINLDGEEFVSSYIRKKTDKISATVPVHIQKTVPLTVSLHEFGSLTAENVTVNIVPKEITLAGERSALESLESLSVATIALSDVSDTGYKATVQLTIPDGIVNVSDISAADVRVTLKDIASKSFTVTRIKVINTPDGKKATLLEKEKQITLRGNEAFLNSLSNSDICLVLDMATVSSSNGKKNVSAHVTVDGASGGFISGDDYKVSVRLENQ